MDHQVTTNKQNGGVNIMSGPIYPAHAARAMIALDAQNAPPRVRGFGWRVFSQSRSQRSERVDEDDCGQHRRADLPAAAEGVRSAIVQGP